MVSNTHKSSNSDGEALPQLISSKTLAYIHQLLQERPLFFYFENDIEVRFYAKRAEEYRRLLDVGKMLFFVLYALISIVAIVVFPEAVMANDLFIFKYVISIYTTYHLLKFLFLIYVLQVYYCNNTLIRHKMI